MPSTTDQSRALVTASEIHAAAQWRLSGWPAIAIERGTAIVGGLVDRGIPLDTSRQEVGESMLAAIILGDRRDPWTGLCALAILRAEEIADIELFYRAGVELIPAMRIAERRRGCSRSGDALDDLIALHLDAAPSIGPADLWEALIERTESGDDAVMVEFDERAQSLSYLLNGPGSDQLGEIRFEAFRRRVQRLRKNLKGDATSS